ncbi:MAG: indole-3-glycerol phosphate synthase TrpC [Lachnospiraceae bacterium]|nr:indole-3-glycerol phosphate synthase TrpC [Lachnospiraceae bacterium]
MILDDLFNSTKKRVEESKKRVSERELEEKLKNLQKRPRFIFEQALKKKGMSYICEIKKASPSKGVISEDFPYNKIASEYAQAGADCISVLTEPEYFKGDIRYLEEIRKTVDTPILRKDFTCDPYMITEAAAAGADAVLLIAAILTDRELVDLFQKADDLGLSAIFEAHDEEEIKRCLAAGARIVGVNNRNLKDFVVDINNSKQLRKLVPNEIIFVAESGIKTNDDIRELVGFGVDAVLIGETLMRSPDRKKELESLNGGPLRG